MDDGRTRHYASLQEAVAAVFGNGARIVQAERVFGGDINQAYRLTLADGRRVFLKANRKENAPFFAAEAAGLAAESGSGKATKETARKATDDEPLGNVSLDATTFKVLSGKGKIVPGCLVREVTIKRDK